MQSEEKYSARTEDLLLAHARTYPKIRPADVFKYAYQSAFGCEHLALDGTRALEYIKEEYERAGNGKATLTEELDGEYFRVHLSYLDAGLSPFEASLRLTDRLVCASLHGGNAAASYRRKSMLHSKLSPGY